MSTLIISGDFNEVTPETIAKINATYQLDLNLHLETGIITGGFDISTMAEYRGESRFNLNGSVLSFRDRDEGRYGRSDRRRGRDYQDDRDRYDHRDDRSDRESTHVQSCFSPFDITDVLKGIQIFLPEAAAVVIITDGYKNLLNTGELEAVRALWSKYIDAVTKEMQEATFRSSVQFK